MASVWPPYTKHDDSVRRYVDATLGHMLIVKGQGVGPIRLGDHRQAVRQALGEFTVFQRVPNDLETDYFTRDGLQVTYDADDVVVFIEAMEPAEPTLCGVAILLARWMTSLRILGRPG